MMVGFGIRQRAPRPGTGDTGSIPGQPDGPGVGFGGAGGVGGSGDAGGDFGPNPWRGPQPDAGYGGRTISPQFGPLAGALAEQSGLASPGHYAMPGQLARLRQATRAVRTGRASFGTDTRDDPAYAGRATLNWTRPNGEDAGFDVDSLSPDLQRVNDLGAAVRSAAPGAARHDARVARRQFIHSTF